MATNIKKNAGELRRNFSTNQFAGERDRWEDYERYLRMMIMKNVDVPTEWKDFLFTVFPALPGVDDQYMFVPEFINRIVPFYS